MLRVWGHTDSHCAMQRRFSSGGYITWTVPHTARYLPQLGFITSCHGNSSSDLMTHWNRYHAVQIMNGATCILICMKMGLSCKENNFTIALEMTDSLQTVYWGTEKSLWIRDMADTFQSQRRARHLTSFEKRSLTSCLDTDEPPSTKAFMMLCWISDESRSKGGWLLERCLANCQNVSTLTTAEHLSAWILRRTMLLKLLWTFCHSLCLLLW